VTDNQARLIPISIDVGGDEERPMPKTKPAIQWAIVIFLLFYIVHAPTSSEDIMGDLFHFISNTIHTLFSVFSFHSNT
jgi:hypothetical protein